MKKFFLSIAALMTAVCVNAQDYEVRTLTFEDNDFKGVTANFAGKLDWSSLIDNPQYGGPMLYPEDFDEESGDRLYFWYDECNTELFSQLTNAYMDGAYWGGGIAISNYIEPDIAKGDYNHQLAVPVSNGSDNFAMVFCNSNPTLSEYNPQVEMTFMDGMKHIVESMNISPSTYVLNSIKIGNDFAKALTAEGDFLTITIYGFADDAETGSVSLNIAKDGTFLEGWTTLDLTSLGAVDKLMLTMNSNDASYGYINHPAYFAMDDVKVRFEKGTTAIASLTTSAPQSAAAVYDMQGRRVTTGNGVNSQLPKGIYIINGKKVMR